MRIVLFASGDFAVPTLRGLVDRGHDLPLVVTQPDRGAGRGRKTTPTPVKAAALKFGLEALSTEDVNSPDMVERLGRINGDLGLVIAFGQKIGPPVRALFRHECVNLHASLLPQYRGAAPVQWALINGEQRTGVTVFRLVDRMDAGPLYVSRWTYTKPEERADELAERLAGIGVDAVDGLLNILQNDPGFIPVPQDETLATKAPKLKKEDGFIRFDQPVRRLANLICGLWPWPGAACLFQPAAGGKAEKLTIALARPACSPRLGATATPAARAAAFTPRGPTPPTPTSSATPAGAPTPEPGVLDYRFYAAAADGFLEILEVRPEAGRVMPFPDFANGRHLRPGDRLLPLPPATATP